MQYAIQCHHQTTQLTILTHFQTQGTVTVRAARTGSGRIAPFIFYLSTRWRWEVSCIHHPLHTQEQTQIPTEYESWVGPHLV